MFEDGFGERADISRADERARLLRKDE